MTQTDEKDDGEIGLQKLTEFCLRSGVSKVWREIEDGAHHGLKSNACALPNSDTK